MRPMAARKEATNRLAAAGLFPAYDCPASSTALELSALGPKMLQRSRKWTRLRS
jgi:hypothetical protein